MACSDFKVNLEKNLKDDGGLSPKFMYAFLMY